MSNIYQIIVILKSLSPYHITLYYSLLPFLGINSIKKDCYKYLNSFEQNKNDASCNFKNLNYYGPKEFLAEFNENVNNEVFNLEWSRNNPLLIRNVHLKLNQELLSAKSYNETFGELTVDLVDCNNNDSVNDQKMKVFWRGFEDSKLRKKDKNGKPMILKLKDCPATDDFKNVLKTRYDDLMTYLPLGDFTSRDGQFNLASYLPNLFLKPDLGPKLYIAYSSAETPKAGTTNLHVDISDAVNVLLYVGFDQNIKNKPTQDEKIHKILENTNQNNWGDI